MRWATPVAVVAGAALVLAQDGTTTTGAGDEGEGGAPPARGLSTISRVLPVGKSHLDVVYPMFDGTRLTTVIRSSEMSRRDDQHLDFTGMQIELFGDSGERDYRVDLETAVYYLESEQLSSEDESVVTSDAFTLRGDGVVFDVPGRIAEFRGNIRMVIHDTSAFKPAGESAAPGSTDADADADAADAASEGAGEGGGDGQGTGDDPPAGEAAPAQD